MCGFTGFINNTPGIDAQRVIELMGDRIRHRVFGEGTVEEVQEAEQSYTIHFDGMMTARKIAFRVKMEKMR